MTVKLLSTRRPPQRVADAATSTHPEYPVVQTFGSDDPAIRQELLQWATRESPAPEWVRLVTDPRGLRVLGRSEGALERVAGQLRQRFGEALVAGAPEVRYFDGMPPLEPYMVVLVSAPARHLARVREDFVARGGRIVRAVDRPTFVLEGEAPLARLLGYYRHVRELLANDRSRSHIATWLSRYVPLGGGGPEAA